jgi:hypothetical protein
MHESRPGATFVGVGNHGGDYKPQVVVQRCVRHVVDLHSQARSISDVPHTYYIFDTSGGIFARGFAQLDRAAL